MRDDRLTARGEERRGRSAERPVQIPLLGWRDIGWRVWRGFSDDALAMVARSIAFSGAMALFPGLAAFVSLYGLFADAGTARDHLALLSGVIPADALALLGAEMVRIATRTQGSLSLTLAISVVVALWSSNTGMRALIRGLNIAYGEHEKRSLIVLNLTSLGFAAAGLLFLLMTTAALIVLPFVFGLLRVPLEWLPLAGLRWPCLWALAFLTLSAAYRLGPSRRPARWPWLTWGGVAASGLWLISSLAFSAYAGAFAGFSATYGSLGALFAFLTWIWISAVIVLFGAKLNAEIEHQTLIDTTVGARRPIGDRGAVMADTVGRRSPINGGLSARAIRGARNLGRIILRRT